MKSPIVHPDQCDSNESSTQNEGTNQIAGNPYIVAIQAFILNGSREAECTPKQPAARGVPSGYQPDTNLLTLLTVRKEQHSKHDAIDAADILV
ncbi:hypothetical protein M8J77_013009 [Diaphorina citri]|nr:hypothetical protein M8J77_013009 [Diaphorina citri]